MCSLLRVCDLVVLPFASFHFACCYHLRRCVSMCVVAHWFITRSVSLLLSSPLFHLFSSPPPPLIPSYPPSSTPFPLPLPLVGSIVGGVVGGVVGLLVVLVLVVVVVVYLLMQRHNSHKGYSLPPRKGSIRLVRTSYIRVCVCVVVMMCMGDSENTFLRITHTCTHTHTHTHTQPETSVVKPRSLPLPFNDLVLGQFVNFLVHTEVLS